MRGTHWLFGAAIFVVLGGTTATYYIQKKVNRANRIEPPRAMPLNMNASAVQWEWSRSDNGRQVVKLMADSFQQISDTGRFELNGLKLNLYQKDNKHYDLIKSPQGSFNQSEGKLISDGKVEITLKVPMEGKVTKDLTSIQSSGITFESQTGKASTQRPAQFHFASGEGTCTGASYDPTTHELHLYKDVVLYLHGNGPKSKTMKVETTELTYNETGSVVYLSPTARLTREGTVLDAGPSVLHIREGKIESVEAQKAHGIDKDPKRNLDYAADVLHVTYNEDGLVQKINGTGNARLHSVSDTSTTTMTADSVDLDFTEQDGDSVLTHTLGNGNAVVESHPLPDHSPKPKTAETKILKSATIDLYMRAGGKEIERVQTQAPGTLEFLPNMPEQHHRNLAGDRMTIIYGPKSQVQSFQATKVTTETFPNEAEKQRAVKAKKPAVNSHTSSVNMTAEFDANGQMKTMRQWDSFSYQEGDRHATAALAVLENDKNLMDLLRTARIWDASGSTDADHIQIDQRSGDFKADGHVNTSRMPDKEDNNKQTSSSGLLDGTETIQGMSSRMTSANKNRLVHYEGNAVLWQGSDRIQSDVIDIDREKHTLKANGKVVTQLLDKQSDKPNSTQDTTAKTASPAFTIVKSPALVYNDVDRLAHYTGGAVMNRPGLYVKGDEIRAFLKEQKKEQPAKTADGPKAPSAPQEAKADKKEDDKDNSRLDKAFTDGNVEIIDSSPLRKRTGTGAHSEYYTADDKIIIQGEQATLVDSVKGTSIGTQITFWSGNDKLEVVAAPTKPQVRSHLKKKK